MPWRLFLGLPAYPALHKHLCSLLATARFPLCLRAVLCLLGMPVKKSGVAQHWSARSAPRCLGGGRSTFPEYVTRLLILVCLHAPTLVRASMCPPLRVSPCARHCVSSCATVRCVPACRARQLRSSMRVAGGVHCESWRGHATSRLVVFNNPRQKWKTVFIFHHVSIEVQWGLLARGDGGGGGDRPDEVIPLRCRWCPSPVVAEPLSPPSVPALPPRFPPRSCPSQPVPASPP